MEKKTTHGKQLATLQTQSPVLLVRQTDSSLEAKERWTLCPPFFLSGFSDPVEWLKHWNLPRQQVVLHCRNGVRSARAVRVLEALGFTNLYSLQGGILGWQEQIQPELARY